MSDKVTAKSDVVVGLILLGLAILFFALSFTLPVRRAGLSPTTFPRFVTIVMALLASGLIVQGVRKQKAATAVSEKRSADEVTRRRRYALRFVLLAVLGIGYTQLIRFLGFVVATPFMMAGTMLLFDEKKWYRIVLVAVISTTVLYGLFRIVFRVPLPRFDLW
ncbi:MAG: tripartite tricarboxylate transporter TctB family protein [Spirochaetaceae bacterium]|nr:MAG: tripartite tricarboxylate transporter TctB family protein [Spirochaetaceae bacterium]